MSENFVADKEILKKVKEILVEVCTLDVAADQLDENASIIEEYGADSLDFLDLLFKLEEEYKITLERGAIVKGAQGDLSDDDFVKDGYLTSAALERLKVVMVEVPKERFPEKLKIQDMMSLFTAKTFTRIVMEQLAEKNK
ncbi:MAG: acyl carrier protein [Oligoflexia bacterium]|nr:acyl carrier protein [Oligoflexia bacterium]